MTLTEQWKKGKLKIDQYYIKYRGIYISDKWYGNCWKNSWSEYVEEVLAPVPSYEEWQEEQKSLKVLAEAYCKEKEENQQLKEEIRMLKEAIYDLDGLKCPKCGNYHRRGWTCSQCGYGK